MKIAFDGKRFFNNSSGLGVYSRTLFKALCDHESGNDYKLLIHDKYLKNSRFKEPELEKHLQISRSIAPSFWRTFQLGVDVDKSDFDVFHGMNNELPQWGLKKVLKVVTIHDLIAYKHPEWFGKIDAKILKAKVESAIKNADRIIVPTEFVKRDIEKYFNRAINKTTVVLEAIESNQELVADNPFTPKQNEFSDYFLFVGNFNERKNLALILAAMDKMDDGHLVAVVGQKKPDAQLSKLIDKLQKQGRLCLFNYLEQAQLKYLYQHAKGLIYPSLEEGFGLPVLEAMQNECAVITTKDSAMSEVAGNGALYIDPQSAESLTSAMKELANQKVLEHLQLECAKQIEKFSPRKMAKETMQIYNS